MFLEHPDQGQLLRASTDRPPKELYEKAVLHSRTVAKDQGIDKLFKEKDLNLLAYSMDALVHNIAAAAGEPRPILGVWQITTTDHRLTSKLH